VVSYFTSVLFYGLQNLSAPRLRIYTLNILTLKKLLNFNKQEKDTFSIPQALTTLRQFCRNVWPTYH